MFPTPEAPLNPPLISLCPLNIRSISGLKGFASYKALRASLFGEKLAT